MAAAAEAVTDESQAYFPDFCAPGTILVVLLVGELVAIVLTLAGQAPPGAFLTELAKMSLYVLWFALLACAMLCRARVWFERTGKTRAFVFCFLLLVLLCLVLAEVAYQITTRFGKSVIIDDTHAGFLLRNFAIGSIVIALAMRYLYIASEWRRSIVLEAQARISALQALIRPHFLFNTMNTIASLVRTAPEHAEKAVEDLSDLLRANLDTRTSRNTLENELGIAAIYARIEKLRLGDRLHVQWDVNDLPPRALIPSLTIQPLIENAVYHGIEQLPDGGEIIVRGHRHGDRLRLAISNPRERRRDGGRGSRMALDNIRQRFELAWGTEVDLRIDEDEHQFCVQLEFPHEQDDGRKRHEHSDRR